MSESLHTDPAAAPREPAHIDRDARIEQLLLAGLDHYFAGDYEQAINVWTRVGFLERGHSRARAYIERARSAVAERHRESEELLQRGVDAFNRGDTDGARELINRAVEETGANDLALVFLERLNRLGPGSPVPHGPKTVTRSRIRFARRTASAHPVRRSVPWLVAAVAVLVAAAALMLLGTELGMRFAERPPATADAMQKPKDDPLPAVRASEVVLARARMLFDGGHLRDALHALDAVGIADPFRAEADTLRADIQRRLLEAARPFAAAPGLPRAADPR